MNAFFSIFVRGDLFIQKIVLHLGLDLSLFFSALSNRRGAG